MIFFSSWNDPHPCFYYLILYLWTKIFGYGEIALRAMSATLGVLLIISTYFVGRNMISRKVGIIASILLLVNPVAVYYSQEARMYTLIPILILYSSYYFYHLLSDPNKKNSILYILISVVLMYTEYLALLLLLSHIWFSLLWFYWRREKKTMINIALAYLAIFCLCIPWLPNIFMRLSLEPISWMRPPTISDGINVTLMLLGVKFMYINAEEFGRFLNPEFFAYVIYVLLQIWGSFVLIVGLIVSLREKMRFKTLLAMLCFLPMIMFFTSVLVIPIFNLRHASTYFPEISIIMATGLISIASYLYEKSKLFTLRKGLTWLMVPFLIVNLFGVYRVYTIDTKVNWREIAIDMEKNDKEKPIVIVKNYLKIPFNYYYRGAAQVIGVTPANLSHIGSLVASKEFILIISHVQTTEILKVLKKDFYIKKDLFYRGARVFIVHKIVYY